ncbi:histidine kinase [Saccharopolyspora sp. K220]|uniref:sensor histidine kinase n=1 Tax=Saccharopolyspora soli TaxID=2926618 RepID=UPI001F563F9A|nr:histidine kinase [Saccharopolyspora soli]MCI2422007.1 histidine kinase [Saccharopolyspora soli]
MAKRVPELWGLLLLAAVVVAGMFVPVSGGPVPYVLAESGVDPIFGLALSIVLAAASLTAVLLLPRRRWPLIVVGLLAWLLMSAWMALCVGSYLAAHRRPQLTWYFVVANGAAVLPTAVGLAIGRADLALGDMWAAVGGAGLFVWLPFVLGLWGRARRDVLDGLRERAAQLEREQAARAEQARLQERARIARDMHDVIAHRVSLMVLHAGGLQVNAADANTAATAELIRTTGQEALAQLRDTIGVLKSAAADAQLGPQPTLVDLDRLLDQSRDAGISVVRHDEGTAWRIPTLLEHAAYRVVQEALTNVHKHAGKARTDVTVRYHETDLEVTVINETPPEPVESLPGSGLGLVGLRERVELLDGEFAAGPRADGGFAVSARLPVSPREPA